MKILLTGAFGNIGESTLRHLMHAGHTVRCFDIHTPDTEEIAKKYVDQLEVMWGDLRNPNHLIVAMKEQEVVIHLGFIIPPLSEADPGLAKMVNVEGMKNLIAAANAQFFKPKIVFGSSSTVAGERAFPATNYLNQVVECEQLLFNSGLNYTILRFSPVPPLYLPKEPNPMVFEIPLDTRFEFLHSRDAGLAVANVIGNPLAWGKTWLIGGGKKNQMLYREFIRRVLETTGVGMLPDSAFSTKPLNLDWLDTEESEKLLQYQRFGFDDYIKQIESQVGLWQRIMTTFFKNKAKQTMLAKSPYYKAAS